MIPVLEAILHQFPYRILGFHCDNGSEFINQNVAGMLEELLIEFTKRLKPGRRGRTRRVYAADGYRTPFEKLSSLPRWQLCLKPGLTTALLHLQASRHSDTEAAQLMQKAKLDVLKRVRI